MHPCMTQDRVRTVPEATKHASIYWFLASTQWDKRHLDAMSYGFRVNRSSCQLPVASTVVLLPMRLYNARVMPSSWWHHQMKIFPRYGLCVKGIHRSPVNSLHKGQWRGALMFSLICAWINGWVNNREAGDLRRHRARNDVIAMYQTQICGLEACGLELPRQPACL